MEIIRPFFFSLQSLSRQSSLAEDRISGSDEDEFLEERSGGTYSSMPSNPFAIRPNSFPQARACKKDNLIEHSTSSLSIEINQPDLIREVLALKTSRTETDLDELSTFQSASFDTSPNERFCGFRSMKYLNSKFKKSESFTKVNEDSKVKKKRKKETLARSCISQWKVLKFLGQRWSFLYGSLFLWRKEIWMEWS